MRWATHARRKRGGSTPNPGVCWIFIFAAREEAKRWAAGRDDIQILSVEEAYQLVRLFSSVVHENVPLVLAAIHAGDWLVKPLLMAVIIGVWRKGGGGLK